MDRYAPLAAPPGTAATAEATVLRRDGREDRIKTKASPFRNRQADGDIVQSGLVSSVRIQHLLRTLCNITDRTINDMPIQKLRFTSPASLKIIMASRTV